MPSSSDPIIDEVRAARDAIAKEFDYDIERIARAMQERQAKGDSPVVRLPPKRIPPFKKVEIGSGNGTSKR